MELLRILFAFGFLTAVCSAMEIQPEVLPRNFGTFCKFCDGIQTLIDNYSYEDYDFWRTIDIQEKIKLFCSFCKKSTESNTKPTSEQTTTESSSTTKQSENPTTIPLPTSPEVPPTTLPAELPTTPPEVPPTTTSAKPTTTPAAEESASRF